MDLTNELLAGYVGGQMEFQNQIERYLYRGEIATAVVEGEGNNATLNVTFRWLAKGEGYPPLPTRWVADTKLDYSVSLVVCSVSNIGHGRTNLSNWVTIENVTFFLPDDSKLDPAKVEGL